MTQPVSNVMAIRVANVRAHVTIFELLDRMGHPVDIETHQIRCPFHADRNPSARVYAEQNKLYCFTCQKSWDVIEGARDFQQTTFEGAVAWLESEFAVPGGARGLVGAVRTQLSAKAPPSVKSAADMVETALRERKQALGFVRYTQYLLALDLTVFEATVGRIAADEVQRRLSALFKAVRV